MPFNATRTDDTPSSYENSARLADAQEAVTRSDDAVRSALRFVARAAAEVQPETCERLKAAARFAADADSAIAEAQAHLRNAREAHDRNQAEYENLLGAVSEHAGVAWQFADAAIERSF